MKSGGEIVVESGEPEVALSTPLPAHLQDLTARARTYVEAASSAKTGISPP